MASPTRPPTRPSATNSAPLRAPTEFGKRRGNNKGGIDDDEASTAQQAQVLARTLAVERSSPRR
ncbi:hypothetical protein DCS_07197 [Drechmeria coniospora]|uniref:Uncharacterized protein n=1 Tax=Drechmeria coniospora TaxID=98403 RepID=A0A151GDR7_DRECN|nr:hypothetical protein DCS_07197 [Drechmeria coniospora]KYK55235.1 hypothetical protein DCS_07197 [Drechmeria coniospora]